MHAYDDENQCTSFRVENEPNHVIIPHHIKCHTQKTNNVKTSIDNTKKQGKY